MSNLFGNTAATVAAPLKKPPVPPPVVQQKPAPIKSFDPPLKPPVGPPSPALQSVGFFGGLGDFAQRAQTVVDSHTKAYGTAPSPALTLAVAKSPVPVQHIPSLFSVPLNETAARAKGVVGDTAPPAVMNEHQLLEGLAGNTAAGGYDQFMRIHGDQIQDLLADQSTRAATTAALAKAQQTNRFQDIQKSGPGLGKTVENILVKAPVAAAAKTVQTSFAAEKDIGNLDAAVKGGNRKEIASAAAMPNLTKTAPAVAQVVRGLVYSPAGVYEAGKALTLDTVAARRGDYSFKHTAALATAVGKSTLNDLNNPRQNAGNLALDVFGLASLGAGSAARLGAAGRALGEEGGIASKVGGAAKAATRPHALRTVTLEKNGFAEEIKLSGSPLTAWLQEFTPGVGTRAAAKKLASDGPTNMFGEPLSDLGPQDRVTEWAKKALSPLSPEARIGRAGNIRRSTEYKALLGLKAEMDATMNMASGTSRLARLARFLPGGNKFTGLSLGEQKALQALSWDDPNPISAEERAHQGWIEQGIGDEKAHKQQMAELALARRALDNPTEKFGKVLDKYLQVVARTEQMRIQMGLGVEAADARVAKAGAILRGESPTPQLPSREDFVANRPRPSRDSDTPSVDALSRSLKSIPGKPGLSIENSHMRGIGVEDDPGTKLVVMRDESGKPIGILQMIRELKPGSQHKTFGEITDSDYGQPDLLQVAVDPSHRRKGIASSLYAAARQAGFNVEKASGKGGYTEEGAHLAYSRRAQGPLRVERQREDSWYTPIIPRGKPRFRIHGETPFQRGTSPYGFGPPAGVNLFGHEMTGKALRNGDFRTDAHHLAGEAYAKTARAGQVIPEYLKAWDAGTETPTGPFDIPMRDVREAPDELRKVIADGMQQKHVDAADAAGLPEEVHKWLYPAETEGIEHVRYIDARLLGNAAKPNLPVGWGARQAEKVNNFLRPLIFYDSPKYALNKVGNLAMLALDEGFLRSGVNMAKSMVSHHHLSEEAEAGLKMRTGAGRSESYVNPKSGAVSQALAEWWAKMTDNSERKASWLYYADRKGYTSWEDKERLLTHDGTDPQLAKDDVDVTRRSDEALVAFDRMTPWEKATIRHYLFVYPWQRGATIWAFHTIFEHPAKTAILNQLGQEAVQDDPWLQHAVKWVQRVGYIPLYWHGNNPVVIDPTSVNTFSTLAQILQTAKAGVEGDKYASAGDLLGPPGQFATHAILGVDQNGNAYPGSQWLGAAEDTLNILPLVAAYKRNQKGLGKSPKLPPFKVTDRSSLAARYNAALGQVVLTPGGLGGFGNLIGGGFTPRELNLTAVAARYWETATPQERHAHEVGMLNDALNLQGQFMKQPVPKGVREAVSDAAQITWKQQQFTKAQGRTPTEKEKLLLTIGYFKDAGRIDDKTAAKLEGRAGKLEAVPDIRAMTSSIHALYGNAKALYQWDSDISTVASLRDPANFNARISELVASGLAKGTPKLSQDARVEYGRGYVQYQHDRQALKARIKLGEEDSFALKVFDDEHDQPVTTNLFGGATAPSYSRFALTEGSTGNVQKRITSLADSPWASLSGVEKSALGVPTASVVSTGWQAYKSALKAYEADPQNSGIQADQKLGLAREIDKVYPGFLKDFTFAQQPKIARFQATTVYKQMPDRSLFNQYIAGPAKQLANTIKQNGDSGYYTKYWRQYIATQVRPWLDSQPALKKEIAMFNKTFLDSLVSRG